MGTAGRGDYGEYYALRAAVGSDRHSSWNSCFFGIFAVLGNTGGFVWIMLGYSVMAGWVPPVIRAVIMGILSAGGLLFNRDKDALNLLGAAVLCMLLWNPLLLYDVSFQLSAGASLGILLFYRPAAGRLKRISWLPRFIAEGIALSVSAQLITIPLVLYNFHRLPSYFILSNL